MDSPSPIASTAAAEKAYSEVEFQGRPFLHPEGNREAPPITPPEPGQGRQETTTLLTQEELVTLKALFDIPQVKEEPFYGSNHVQPALKGQFFDVKG